MKREAVAANAGRRHGSAAGGWLLSWTGGLLLLPLASAGEERGTGRLHPCRILAMGISPSEFKAGEEIMLGVTYRCEAAVGAVDVQVTHQPGDAGGPVATGRKDAAVLHRGQAMLYSSSVRAGRGGCYTVVIDRGGRMSATLCPQPVRWGAQTIRFSK